MEQSHTSGFDYGRVRDKMLKSWGRKPTEKEAPRREKTARKPENQKTSFKESKKSAKIEIRKEPSKPVKKPALPNPAQAQMGKVPESMEITRQIRVFPAWIQEPIWKTDMEKQAFRWIPKKGSDSGLLMMPFSDLPGAKGLGGPLNREKGLIRFGYL